MRGKLYSLVAAIIAVFDIIFVWRSVVFRLMESYHLFTALAIVLFAEVGNNILYALLFHHNITLLLYIRKVMRMRDTTIFLLFVVFFLPVFTIYFVSSRVLIYLDLYGYYTLSTVIALVVSYTINLLLYIPFCIVERRSPALIQEEV